MNIVLLGDSITDMGRKREATEGASAYGNGYAFFLQGGARHARAEKI